MLKEIPNFTDYYADEEGNIYSKKRGNRLKKMKPQYQEQWGYFSVNLVGDDGKKKHMTVHRMVATAFLPNPSNLPEVNHIDGDKTNNHLSNLEWVTRSDNLKHAFSLGLNCSKGVNNGRATLSESEVVEIYHKLLSGQDNVSLSKEYNTSVSVISDIKTRSAWEHITKDLPVIPIKFKSKDITDDIVNFICSKLQEGINPTPILHLCLEKFGKNSVRIDSIYDIKRRKSFKHISSKYKW